MPDICPVSCRECVRQWTGSQCEPIAPPTPARASDRNGKTLGSTSHSDPQDQPVRLATRPRRSQFDLTLGTVRTLRRSAIPVSARFRWVVTPSPSHVFCSSCSLGSTACWRM